MKLCCLFSSGSKSIAAEPSSGRPSLGVAPAVKSIASAACVLPVPPWPTIAIVLSRPISSTAMEFTSLSLPARDQRRFQSAAPRSMQLFCVDHISLLVRSLHTHLTRDDSLDAVSDV